MSYSFSCLYTRPDLIDSCAKLLKSVWPCTQTDRLPRLVKEEGTGLPCSFVLIKHQENLEDCVVGHVRVVLCRDPESVYLEALCVDKSHRGLGLQKQLILSSEEYSATLDFKVLFFSVDISRAQYYKDHLSYQILPRDFILTSVGGNVLGHYDGASTWPGNEPYPGWESCYNGTTVNQDEMKDTWTFVSKSLR